MSEVMDGAAAGLGERAMELMAQRARSRVAFGKPIAEQSSFVKELAGHRVQLDAARCAQSPGLPIPMQRRLQCAEVRTDTTNDSMQPVTPVPLMWSTCLLHDSSRVAKSLLRLGPSSVRPGADWGHGPCACRWTVLAAAEALDRVGAKDARGQIAAAKVRPCRRTAKWKLPYCVLYLHGLPAPSTDCRSSVPLFFEQRILALQLLCDYTSAQRSMVV